MIKVGHRVKVMSIGRKGSVEFIDWPRLSLPWMYPVQVTLDRPYGECNQTMYRTSANDLKKLKKNEIRGQNLNVVWVDEVSKVDLTEFEKYLRKFDKSL